MTISCSNSLITDEVPSGVINNTGSGGNSTFTTAKPYVGGSLEVYINGVKQIRGSNFTEYSPGTGSFITSSAPLVGDVVTVNYQYTTSVSGNADTVDGIHASVTPIANSLTPLGSDSKYSVKVLPGTILASSTRDTALNWTSGEVTILSITFTVTQDMVDSGRKLKLSFFAPQLYSNDATARSMITIYEGTTVIARTYQPSSTGTSIAFAVNISSAAITMPSVGSHTYVAKFSRDAGSGTPSLYAETGAVMYLEAEIK